MLKKGKAVAAKKKVNFGEKEESRNREMPDRSMNASMISNMTVVTQKAEVETHQSQTSNKKVISFDSSDDDEVTPAAEATPVEIEIEYEGADVIPAELETEITEQYVPKKEEAHIH